MQARAVPVDLGPERLRVEVDVDAVTLAQSEEQVAGDPELVGSALGAPAEDLELPLALRDLGVHALDPDPRRQAEVDVLVDDLPRDVADVLEADAGVVLALRRREALLREPERYAVAVEEVLLLESEPGPGVVGDRRAAVRRVRRPVREEHLAQHEHPVAPGGIGEERGRLEDAVRARAFRLARRAAVEVPARQLLERRGRVELGDLRLRAQVRHRLVAVEPDVLELDLHSVPPSALDHKKRRPRPDRS